MENPPHMPDTHASAPSTKPPETFHELFEFYTDVVKVLYSQIQTENRLPTEVLLELHAALDHISRVWVKSKPDPEKYAVGKAYSHLKRSCLDIFKIHLKITLDQSKELTDKVDISLIDNGEFETRLKALTREIKQKAALARQQETLEVTDTAFMSWNQVVEKCKELQNDYYFSPKIPWAKRKTTEQQHAHDKKTYNIGLVTGVISGLITGIIVTYGIPFLWKLLAG